MIRLLIALHPAAWRRRYGPELHALLEATPLTVGVVFDVGLNAARQHRDTHPVTARVLAGLAVSLLVELGALREHLTDNLLWAPTTTARAVALAMLLLAWLPHHERRRSPS